MYFLPQLASTAEDRGLLRLFLRAVLCLPFVKPSIDLRSRRALQSHWFPVGWSCFPGRQTTRVFGRTAPTKSRCMQYMEREMPATWLLFMAIVEKVWEMAVSIFPEETAIMRRNNAGGGFLAGTGFHKADIAMMRELPLHIDRQNTRGSIAAVLVLGDFRGGEASFVVTRDDDPTDKREISVSNWHGSLFVGHYESILHEVKTVTLGTRVAVACYSNQAVWDFQRVIRAGNCSWATAQRIKMERKFILQFAVPEEREAILKEMNDDDWEMDSAGARCSEQIV